MSLLSVELWLEHFLKVFLYLLCTDKNCFCFVLKYWFIFETIDDFKLS